MSSAAGCPSENVLLRFPLGDGREAELAWLEQHLDTCESCRRSLAAAATEEPGASPGLAPLPGPGQQVGKYQLEELRGAGGMGVVYAARDPSLGRRVALKFLRHPTDAASAARLRREAQTMAQLAHPHVVPVFELGEWDGQLFLAMELVEGHTLDAWCRGPAPRAERTRALLEAAQGLAAAHAAGVVHRDFKPANVLLGPEGRARVTDFGLARPAGTIDPAAATPAPSTEGALLTRDGALLGTLAFMAPEQLAGKPADARSDQFAWCVAFVEALTGRRPFEGATVDALSQAIERGPRLDGLPRSLRSTIKRGLAIDPSRRFGSMGALLDALATARRRQLAVPVALSLAMVAVIGSVALLRPTPVLTPVIAAPVVLAVGETQEVDLHLRKLERLAVGDPSIAQVTPGPDGRLSMTGLKLGTMTVVAWDATHRRTQVEVEVSAPHPSLISHP